ncbi:SCO2523 family variant P-loop protein [Luedemannella helvata]|uniref:SCO2523 family variant P-loop protein n=1 Tax=Luedemannella helvata TaxID=349315 RepID=A0ABN2KLR8_9ACTN
MLVFATSDKGGTGRSVTSSNIMYRRALHGSDVCYADFDFGSPTAGSIFDVDNALRGTPDSDGLHSYLQGIRSEARKIEVWKESDRHSLRRRPALAGRLVLLPGDLGGAEFAATAEIVDRCARLFRDLEEEFDLTLVDLSAGRSYATGIVLAATARPEFAGRFRWIVYHRWTRQHVLAAANLIYGHQGILETARDCGHDPVELKAALRTVRTAVVDPERDELGGLSEAQIAWLRASNRGLRELATTERVGRTMLLGSVPLDPVLQWREQLISDNDVLDRGIANEATVKAFESLGKRLVTDEAWETL